MNKSRLPSIGVIIAASTLLFAGCSNAGGGKTDTSWKNGVYYEIFVRSFYDGNGDGIGDLRGITEKLDYLNDGNPKSDADLGVDAIWLMPIYASPSYHGYDVTDYYNVNPQYGTLDDFRELTKEAHKRGMKVILDLPINNTSNHHPWFTEASTGQDSKYRDWFIWAEDQGLSTSTVGAFGTKPWHESEGSHYMGIYHDSMPDLNYDSAEVRAEMIRIGKFWLEQGADGFRLDSAKHLYWKYSNSGKDPETSRKNVAWWQEFRKGLLETKADVYLVGEIWDTNAVIAPFLDHALDSGFNFDYAEKLVKMAKTETAEDLGYWLKRIHDLYDKASEGQFIEAMFLTNHDQNRVMSQLKGNIDQAKMAAALLLTMPGNTFIYYGEEIGMTGEKPDEYIREPMIWQDNPADDPGQTSWLKKTPVNKQRPASVTEQLKQDDSLLARYKTLTRWKRQEDTLRNGKIGAYSTDNERVAGFIRYTDKETALVVHNLSGQPQTIELTAAEVQQETDAKQITFTKIARATEEGTTLNGQTLSLPAYGSAVLK